MDKVKVAEELVKVAKELVSARKWLTKLISPSGDEFWEAYGPMVKDRNKATRFTNPKAAERAALGRFGRSGIAFWESEKRHESLAQKEYRDWSYEVEDEMVAAELVKVAKELMAWEENSLIDGILDQNKLGDLNGYIDDQTYDLMLEVYEKLQSDFKVSNSQNEAINRLKMCSNRARTMHPDEHRNNIFKAAHALGIKLPSSMF